MPTDELRKLVLSVLVASASAQLVGCSLIFVKKAPPSVPEGQWAECSEGKFAPIADVVVGTSFVMGALGISQVEDEDPELRNVAGAIYGLGGLALLYSAYVGFTETSRCGRIHDAAEARGIYGPYPAQPYPYPYPPPYGYPPPQQPYPQPQPPPQPAPYPQPQPVPAPPPSGAPQ